MTPDKAWQPGGVWYLQVTLHKNALAAGVWIDGDSCGSTDDSLITWRKHVSNSCGSTRDSLVLWRKYESTQSKCALRLRTPHSDFGPMGYFDTVLTVKPESIYHVETRLRPYVEDSVECGSVDGLCVQDSWAFLFRAQGPRAVSLSDLSVHAVAMTLNDGDTLRKLLFNSTGTRAYAVTSCGVLYFLKDFTYNTNSGAFTFGHVGAPHPDPNTNNNVLLDVCARDSFVYAADDAGVLYQMRSQGESLVKEMTVTVSHPTKVRTGAEAAYVLGRAESGRGGLYAWALPAFNEVHEEEWWGPANGLFLDSSYAYVAHGRYQDGAGALQIADLSSPLEPLYISRVPMSDARDVAVQHRDSLACVADGAYGGLAVVNVQDRYRPTVVGRCVIETFHRAVAVSDSFAYVATDQGLLVYRIR
jgi:hypothetical protein